MLNSDWDCTSTSSIFHKIRDQEDYDADCS